MAEGGKTNLDIVVRVINETKKSMEDIGSDVKRTLNDIKAHGKEAGNAFKGISEAADGLQKSVRLLTTAGGLTLLWEALKPLVELPLHLAEAASKSEELERGMLLIGRAAGFTSDEVKKASEEIQKLGATSEVTAKNLQRLLVSGVSPEQATALAQTAKQIASAQGKAYEEVLDAVAGAVTRGTTRYLRIQYGLAVDANLEFIKKQRELGRQLYEDERRSVLAEAITKRGAVQFPATGGEKSTTELQDSLRVAMNNLATTVGRELVPTMREWLVLMTEIADFLNNSWTAAIIRGALAAGKFVNPVQLMLMAMRAAREHENAPQKEVDAEIARLQAKAQVMNGISDSERAKQLQDEQRAEQNLKFHNASEKEKAEATLERVNTELQAIKSRNEAEARADQYLYDNSLLALDKFYQQKRERDTAEYNAEQKRNEQALQNAKDAYARIQGEADLKDPLTGETRAKGVPGFKGANPGSEAAFSALGEIQKAEEAITRSREAMATKRVNSYVDERQALSDLNKARDDEIDKAAQAANDQDLEAALTAITHKYDALAKTLKDVGKSFTGPLEAQEKERKTYEITNKIIEQRVALEQALLNVQRSQVNADFNKGRVTEIEQRNRINDLARQELALKQQQLADYEKEAPKTATDQRDLELKVRNTRKEIADLQGSIITAGDLFRREFVNDLGVALGDIINKAKTFNDAMKQLGNSIRSYLTGEIGKGLAGGVVKMVVQITGEENSPFAIIGKLLGDKAVVGTTPATAMWVRVVPGGGDLGGSFAKYGTPGSGGWFNTAGDASAGGSWVDAGAEDLLTTAAEGGPVVGPAHTGGGVNINAEGGEFIVRKSEAWKWMPLLEAINLGRVPSLPSRRYFAEGGSVPMASGDTGGGGHGKTEVNISFNGTNPAVTGNTEGGVKFGRIVSSIVQSELIKHQRPGGLLNKRGASG